MTLALTDCCDAGVICRLLKLYGCSHNCSVPVQSDSNSKTKVIETVGKEKHTKKKKKRKEKKDTKPKQNKQKETNQNSCCNKTGSNQMMKEWIPPAVPIGNGTLERAFT